MRSKMWQSTLLATVFLCVAGCARVQDSSAVHARDLILPELRWLKQDPTGKGVIILKEKATEKFIQFSGRKLFVYLPHQTLSAEEMERANSVMRRFGVKKEVYPLGEGSSSYMQTAFQKDLDGDEAVAFKIADAVFREVYRFPPGARIRATRKLVD